MEFTYPKSDKLKSRKVIQQLFLGAKSVSKYPLRLVYFENPDDSQEFKFGVSVSKRYFKKAVDRNYYKRILRECYRLNQAMLESSKGKYQFMLLYQTNAKLPYAEVYRLTQALFEKFVKQTAEASQESPKLR